MSRFKKGDKVLCVDDSNMGLITNCKVYDVYDVKVFLGYMYIGILTNNGTYDSYDESRFINIRVERNCVIDNILK